MSSISIRGIEIDDAADLLVLRNLDSDLKYFQHPQPVSTLEHQAWVKGRVDSSKEYTLVLEVDSVVVGVAYVNSLEKAEVAIRLDAKFRNQGYANMLLNALEESLSSLNVPQLIAVIHEENQRSLDFFKSADYTVKEMDFQSPFIRLSKIIRNKSGL